MSSKSKSKSRSRRTSFTRISADHASRISVPLSGRSRSRSRPFSQPAEQYAPSKTDSNLTPAQDWEGEGEVPVSFVNTTLRESLFKFTLKHDEAESLLDSDSKATWGVLHIRSGSLVDENNNRIDLIDTELDNDNKETESEDFPESEFSESNYSNSSASAIRLERKVTLGPCADYQVLHVSCMTPDCEGIFPFHKFKTQQFQCKAVKSQTYVVKKASGQLANRLYQWEIPPAPIKSDESVENLPEKEILSTQTEHDEEEIVPKIVEAPTDHTISEDQAQGLTHEELKEASKSLRKLREAIYKNPNADSYSQTSQRESEGSIICPQVFEGDYDFMTDLMRNIVPDSFEAEFVSTAFDYGSKVLNAGLLFANSFIGDESNLDPREDTVYYNGYKIRCSGRGLLLQGVYLNCNRFPIDQQEFQVFNDSEGESFLPDFRVRVVVQLMNASIPFPGEHDYSTKMEQRVEVDEEKWTLHYGPVTEFGAPNFVEIYVPLGVSPCLIRHFSLPNGYIAIKAP